MKIMGPFKIISLAVLVQIPSAFAGHENGNGGGNIYTFSLLVEEKSYAKCVQR